MSLTPSSAFARISRQLRDAELKTDAALLAAADLMSSLVQARALADVAPHKGQQALIRLVRAQQSIIEGSNDIFRVHDVMSGIGQEMGLFDESTPTDPFKGIDDQSDQKAA